MELNARTEGLGVIVLEYREDTLDLKNVREFREAVMPLIEDKSNVIFDMTGVKFVDSSGLGALIACQRTLNRRRGEFRICSLTNNVRALFELMRMHKIFHIYGSRAEALIACD